MCRFFFHVNSLKLILFGESKVLQHFDNMMHNLATLDAFVKVVKMTNYKITSLSATGRIFVYGLAHGLGIHGFRLSWAFLVIEILATKQNILKLFDYCIMINCTFTFCRTNVFGCICGVKAQFELVNHKFTNLTMLHIPLCGFQCTHGGKQCLTCQHTNYQDTTNHNGYLEQLQLCYIHAAK